jgi:short-subunit dehydrogenase
MKAADARVLLTGASGGLGQAMTQALRQAGSAVMGVSRSGVEASPSGTQWVRADLSTDAGLAAVVAAAADWRANVLVHAAGVPSFGALASVTPSQMQAVLQTNLLAPMRLTQSMLPQLQRQAPAQIVFVGSALGRIGLPGFSVYGASKAGLHGFAEALRRELSGTGVRIQILGPRSTRTGFNGAAVEAYNRSTGTAMDMPETVAAALLTLIESEAAERFLGFPERLAVRLNGLLGARLDGSFAKHRLSLLAAPTTPASLEIT